MLTHSRFNLVWYSYQVYLYGGQQCVFVSLTKFVSDKKIKNKTFMFYQALTGSLKPGIGNLRPGGQMRPI